MKLMTASRVFPWTLLPLSRTGYAVDAGNEDDFALRECIAEAVKGDSAKAQFSNETDFLVNDVKPFNLNLQWTPFAITYPDTSEEVAAVVSGASDSGRKVQTRSGGRDFINKCTLESFFPWS